MINKIKKTTASGIMFAVVGVGVLLPLNAQAQTATCWDRYIASYADYPTTSKINNNAGYEGLQVMNGSNTIMHWFAKKDTMHYYYKNGVEECDKNGAHKITWVFENGAWKHGTTSTFIPYARQATGASIIPTREPVREPTQEQSSVRPSVNILQRQYDHAYEVRISLSERSDNYRVILRRGNAIQHIVDSDNEKSIMFKRVQNADYDVSIELQKGNKGSVKRHIQIDDNDQEVEVRTVIPARWKTIHTERVITIPALD